MAEAVLSIALLIPALVIVLWIAGAIYFDACGGARWGRWIALGWVAGAVVTFAVWSPVWQPFLVLLAVLAGVLVWWFRQRPRHDREWDPAVAVLPRAVVNGDEVTVENVRRFEYRSAEDYTPRYETRTVRLSNLRGADVILFNWGVRWMSHPVLVFDFGPDGYLGISIEVRYRKGQVYSVLRSLFRQQELIYVVADERDLILRRLTVGRPQTAHLYRLTVEPERVRVAFLDYVSAINDLRARPRWYHGVCANCTTTFYRLPNSRPLRDVRLLLNGRLDEALYETGRIDRSLPFADLRRSAAIHDLATTAPAEGFGDHLRHELERRRHGR